MSDTKAAVADPKSFDPDEVAKFKGRFGAARGKEIESANADAVLQEQAVAKLQVRFDRDQKAAKLAETAWSAKRTLRFKKSTPGPETPPEAGLREESEKAAAKKGLSEAALKTAREELAALVKKLEQSPREAYNNRLKQINKRYFESTKATGGKGQTLQIGPDMQAKLKQSFDTRDFDGADACLNLIEDTVFATVAAREMAGVHAKLAGRAKTLTTQGLGDPGQLQAITSQLASVDLGTPTGEALAELERVIEPALRELEDRIQVFLDLYNILDAEIAGLARKANPKAADHRTEIGKCRNIAKGKLEDAEKRLADLEKAVATTTKAAQEAAAAETAYPVELATILQRIAGFPGISASHKEYSGLIGPKSQVQVKLAQAKSSAAAKDFVYAVLRIGEVDELLDGFDTAATNKQNAKADAADKQKLADTKKAAADKQDKAAADEKAKKAQALKAKIDAMDTDSLDAIGKDADFDAWMDKVDALRTHQPAIVEIKVGQSYWLNGNNTAEIEVEVTAGDFADFFVVHYHPYPYLNPYTAKTEQPKMHAKPYCGNAMTPHDYRVTGSSHWLFGLGLPKLDGILNQLP